MKITIITDNRNSWFIPYGLMLQEKLSLKHTVKYVDNKNDIENGDICFILSCTKIIEKSFLDKNKNNIVVHASDLPDGKGFSPLQWQILEGKNIIPLTLFEANELVDNGDYYIKDCVNYEGHELHDELREKLAYKIIDMCVFYVENQEALPPRKQLGIETFYRKRTSKDDELDVNKSINDLFNHFRIADYENYPLYFIKDNTEYILKIQKRKK